VTALVVEELEVRYGPVRAVRGLSLEVRPGEIVGLIGPNGAGKSSTLHAIMGAAPIAAGDVRLGEDSLIGLRSEDVARRGIALVPEGRRIFGELSVEENLKLGFAARRSRGDLAYVYDLFPVVRQFRKRKAASSSSSPSRALSSPSRMCSYSMSRLSVSPRRSSTSSSRPSSQSAIAVSPSSSSSSAPSARSRSRTARTCSQTASCA
jgi:branched-chain amino acid transport system ATP-binding protein